MPFLTIPDDPPSDFVKINVLGRMFPEVNGDYFDANLLDTMVEVHVGGFGGTIAAEIRTDEFRSFRDELEQLFVKLDGSAQLYVLQGQINLNFQGDGLGHFKVRGSVTDRVGVGNVLEFQLHLDQTFLPDLLAQLDEIDVEFPVLGDRDTRS
jgi:hypothetical protein